MPNRDGLREDIEGHMEDWLITGRTLEINESASVIQDMKKALDILGVSLDE